MNFDTIYAQGGGDASKNPSNRNILQVNTMSQNNAQAGKKSQFKDNENLNNGGDAGGVLASKGGQSKLASIRAS